MQDIRQETLNECTRAEQSASVVLWEIDLTEVGGERYFFCNEQNEKGEPVTWQGRQYQPYPIQGSGFELNGKGTSTRPTLTVSTVTISDDHNFDRQIIIPPIIFNGIAYDDPGSGNNPGGTRYTGYGFEVRKNGVLIASRETKGAIPGSYSAVIDMPSGRGSVTLEFKIFQKGNQGAGNITDCTVIVTKKAASGISIR